MAPAKPLLRFSAIRQLNTSTPDADEEQFARGRYFDANCLATDAAGDLVYITGDSVGGTFQVAKIDPTDPAKMPAVGIIHSKSSALDCLVLTFGLVNANALAPGQRYFADTDGTLTAIPPTPAIGASVIVQAIGVALDAVTLKIDPSLHMVRLVGY